MGNAAITLCFNHTANSSSSSSSSSVKLIFWEGTSRTLKGKHIAGEIMFEFPEMMVCHADSFFIGHPIPVLSINDELMLGQTYFILPIDRFFAINTLSVSSISAFGSCPNKSPIKFGKCPFQYLKGSNGRVVIKVMPEFITGLICGDNNNDKEMNENEASYSNGFLCSTPELKKHYEQLVKSKDQVWSPKLETITEYKVRFSPCRFIEWKEKEKPIELY